MATRRTILAAALAVLGLVAAPAVADPEAAAADPAIEAVIANQLAAFRSGDVGAAFAHASPGIQQKFETPERFGRMVEQLYPMIWRPAGVEWRGIERRGDGTLAKRVLFTDSAGALFEVDYLMGKVDGVWRIEGVQMRRLPGVSS